jgi:4'-phosphopantetheinyl transferase
VPQTPGRRLLPPADTVHLWFTPVGEIPRILDEAPDPPPRLSPAEEARAARFRDLPSRARFVTARQALRAVLHGYLGVTLPPDAIQVDPSGKPFLAEGVAPVPLEFSIAHAGDWVVLAFSLGAAVGVDLERARPLPEVDGIAARVFGPGDLGRFRALPVDQRSEAFLRGWTRKEALLKALGTGFALPPAAFEAGLGPGVSEVRVPAEVRRWPRRAEAWTILSVEAPPGYAAAVARAGGRFRAAFPSGPPASPQEPAPPAQPGP